MKITVVGAGYVGLSIGLILSRKHKVSLLDIDDSKIELINKKKSPIDDKEIKKFIEIENINLIATSNKKEAYHSSKLVIVATPTDYNLTKKEFNTKIVESVIKDSYRFNKKHFTVVKSTVPIGFTARMKKIYRNKDIIFSPEFLREGSSITDNLYPSRIIVGDKSPKGKIFGNLMLNISNIKKEKSKVIYMGADEAESVKLFSNSYLALRVSYFNEVDTFCEKNNLSTKSIITGMSLDKRIGNDYNNPSFGYGGYCLPKDSKQLLHNYRGTPNSVIKSIVESNKIRKKHISNSIIKMKPRTVGFYKLAMKEGSSNFRESAIQDIIRIIKKAGIVSYIYEPTIKSDTYIGLKVLNNLKLFKSKSHLIVANRYYAGLKDVKHKVYTRDIFHKD